jgi:hypothetical protein
MKSITSVSGGKTSAMMAIEFPTDHYIFAVVLVNHPPSAPKDKGLFREIQKRIPHFIASQEADLTLLNMLRLEQELGKAINWVASEFTMDDFILNQTDLPRYRTSQPMLPNAAHRFCTEQTKLNPMFWHCYLNYFDGKSPLLMNIGLRWDEPKRVERWTCDKDRFKYPYACSLQSLKQWQYRSAEWRVSNFPMFDAGISSLDVAKYWLEKGWVFPEVSNCRFCFHHRDIQQQRQAELEPENLQWWIDMEEKAGKTFGNRSLKSILQQPLLNVYDEKPCNCTD